jgi:hypothetical protein
MWAFGLAAALSLGLAIYFHGPKGLPPERAPLGFTMPLILPAFALLLVVEADRFRAAAGHARAESAARFTALCGWAFIGNANSYAFWSGLALGVTASVVGGALYSWLFGRKAPKSDDQDDSQK